MFSKLNLNQVLINLCIALGIFSQPLFAQEVFDNLCLECPDSRCPEFKFKGLKFALVIGIDEYGTVTSKLENSVNDAISMAKILKNENYSVRCLKNINVEQAHLAKAHIRAYALKINRSIKTDKNKIRNTRAVFYFSGHGGNISGDNRLILSPEKNPEDPSAVNLESLSMKFEEFTLAFSGLKNIQPILMLDACRSELVSSGVKGPRKSLPYNIAKDYPNTTLGYLISYAAQNLGWAIDKDDTIGAINNGLFMTVFKRHAKKYGRTLEKILNYTESEVSKLSNQGQLPDRKAHAAKISSTYDWRQPGMANNYCSFAEAILQPELDKCTLGNEEDVNGCLSDEKVCRAWKKIKSTVIENRCVSMFPENIRNIDEQCPITPIAQIPPSRAPASVNSQHVSFSDNQISNSAFDAYLKTSTNFQLNPDDFLSPYRTATGEIDVSNFQSQKIRKAYLKPISSEISNVSYQLKVTENTDILPFPGATKNAIRLALSGSKLKVDCETMTCPPGWVGVSTKNAAGSVVRGYIAANPSRYEIANKGIVFKLHKDANTVDPEIFFKHVDRLSKKEKSKAIKILAPEQKTAVNPFAVYYAASHARDLLEAQGYNVVSIDQISIPENAPILKTQIGIIFLHEAR